MTVRIVTDSTCDLPRSVVVELGVTVVPLTVLFGDEALLDGVEIDSATFFERMRRFPGLPKTSQPSVARFKEAYQAAGADGSEIVSIHISSRMSGTLNSASVAREQLIGEVHVDLIDSYQVSLGLGAVVLEAAAAAATGAGIAEVSRVAHAAIGRTRVVAVVDTLEYLRRGGRIGRAASLVGGLLSIKPILQMTNGELAPFERVRTRAKAVDRLAQIAVEDQTIRRLFVAAAGDDAATAEFIERVRPRLPHTDIRFGQIGPVVGAHSGPGLLGICPVRRE